MSQLKAYKIRSTGSEVFSYVVLVFAASPNKAKAFALGLWEFEGHEYTELRIERCKAVDHHAKGDKTYRPVFFNDSTIPIYRDAGIYQADEPTCDTCGLSSFGKPEYEVCEGCNNCKECLGEAGCDCESEAESESALP